MRLIEASLINPKSRLAPERLGKGLTAAAGFLQFREAREDKRVGSVGQLGDERWASRTNNNQASMACLLLRCCHGHFLSR